MTAPAFGNTIGEAAVFGVRQLAAAFSRADLSARSSSPQQVAVTESGDESPHSKFRPCAVVRNVRSRCAAAGQGGDGIEESGSYDFDRLGPPNRAFLVAGGKPR